MIIIQINIKNPETKRKIKRDISCLEHEGIHHRHALLQHHHLLLPLKQHHLLLHLLLLDQLNSLSAHRIASEW